MTSGKPTRDKEKYQYFLVGINKENTELLEQLEQDRKRMGLRYISQVIAVRVDDYYTQNKSMSAHAHTDETDEENTSELDVMIAEQELLNNDPC